MRLYDPGTGGFLSLDPVYGGGDNPYGYPTDPVHQYDLDGKLWGAIKRATKKVGRLVWRYKWDIALTAAGFIPGVGAIAWGPRVYRVVRAAQACQGMGEASAPPESLPEPPGDPWFARRHHRPIRPPYRDG
ncbi:hypothetical protein N0X72_21900 [Streptomyces carpaticus]|uniref:hypothetical protein n=1 Tax=Streptomyces TaxID=1883 RepID=UPI0021FC1D22|nr:hypothetical protein N0X72_21900 [Streptomyces carpaticus]